MTGQKSKFNELDERISGQDRFGDFSTVEIEGRGSKFKPDKNAFLMRYTIFLVFVAISLVLDNYRKREIRSYLEESICWCLIKKKNCL